MASFHDAVRRAAKAVGGQAKLAAAIGCAQSEISRLSTTAQTIPAETAVAIVQATRGTADEVKITELLPSKVIEAVRSELTPAEPQAIAS